MMQNQKMRMKKINWTSSVIVNPPLTEPREPTALTIAPPPNCTDKLLFCVCKTARYAGNIEKTESHLIGEDHRHFEGIGNCFQKDISIAFVHQKQACVAAVSDLSQRGLEGV
jgi:hypothetical protein